MTAAALSAARIRWFTASCFCACGGLSKKRWGVCGVQAKKPTRIGSQAKLQFVEQYAGAQVTAGQGSLGGAQQQVQLDQRRCRRHGQTGACRAAQSCIEWCDGVHMRCRSRAAGAAGWHAAALAQGACQQPCCLITVLLHRACSTCCCADACMYLACRRGRAACLGASLLKKKQAAAHLNQSLQGGSDASYELGLASMNVFGQAQVLAECCKRLQTQRLWQACAKQTLSALLRHASCFRLVRACKTAIPASACPRKSTEADLAAAVSEACRPTTAAWLASVTIW